MTHARTSKPEILERLRDGSREGSDAELSALFRAVGDPEPLSSAELAEVRRRLVRRATAPRSGRLRELVLVGAALLSGAGVAFGALGVVEWVRAPASPSATAHAGTSGIRPARAPNRQRRPLAAPPSSAEVVLGEVGPSPSKAPSARFAEARSAEPLSSTPPARSALARESESLARALVALRRDHDARAALALLDAHEAEFPGGALGLEARVARVDALVALRRKTDALSVLATLPLDRVGRGAELRLLRAELTAERDCAEASADLDALVATAPAALRERALYARASCRLRLGDRAAAEHDLRRYLTDYPRGRFAREVEERLR
jgi:hypothetical protein